MSLVVIVRALLLLLVVVLAAVWWLRRSRRGLDWVMLAVPLAFAASYLSGLLLRVPEYQSGCAGTCPGWWGWPIATHTQDGLMPPRLDPAGFAANAAVYYAVLLVASALVARLAQYAAWPERSRRWRAGFLLLVVVLPLALAPRWAPPPEPTLPREGQRLAINAARGWRWHLQLRRITDQRLAIEDVRMHPDGERHRACFRIYTWFYLPVGRVYVDLEPAGVRAVGGGVIPLTASCWVQP